MFKLNPVLISLVAAQGIMFPASLAFSATLKPFTPEFNDNRAGVFCVCNGSTQTLSGNAQFAPGLNGTQSVSLAELRNSGRITADNVIGNDRLTLGEQNLNVLIPNFEDDTYTLYPVYDNRAIAALAPVDLATEVNDFVEVGDAQYIDARVAQVSNGTIIVDIGEEGAATTATTNGWRMAAKQSQLFTASGKGNMVWDSSNRVSFNGETPLYGDRLAYDVENVVTWGGEFTVTTLDGGVNTFNVTNIAELQRYNDWLSDQLTYKNLSTDSYNREFNKAISINTGTIVYTMSARDPDDNDDITQPVGDRTVLSADGPGATVKINAGKTLEVENASNGAVRASNGAKAIIDGKLASTGNGLTESNALELVDGSKGINNGVINGGFFNQADGTGVDTSTLGYSGKTVYARSDSKFINNGVLNYAISANPQSQDSAALWLSNARGVNTGNINVGVADVVSSRASAGVILSTDRSAFTNVEGGTIYLGRGPQNTLTDEIQDVAINALGGLSGIAQVLNSQVINNGRIVIGSLVQNAMAMRVEAGPDATTLNNGVIDINGRAQFQPAENIGMLVIDSGTGGKVGNTGSINLNGDNGTGIKVVATEGNRAHAFSSGSLNVSGRADDANGTRNTAIWVVGEEGGQASADLTGTITLSGEAAIGVRAEGNASVNVARSAVPVSGGGQYQINFLASGDNAHITLPKDTNYGVSSWYSTVFRYEEGADFDGAGLTITPDASFAKGVVGSGACTEVNTHDATLNVGGYATGVVIEGGAQGVIDAETTINMNNINAVAALVDGDKHDITGRIVNPIPTPFSDTTLTNHAAINGVYDRQTGLIARNQGQLINTGNITLGGVETTGIAAYYGANVTNSGDISITDNGTALYAEGYSFTGDGETPASITNSGTLNVTGGNSDNIYNAHGAIAYGPLAEIHQNGTVNLYGNNVIAGEAFSGGTLYLGRDSTVVFHDAGQTAYRALEADTGIWSESAKTDVSTANSTLLQLGGGAFYYPTASGEVTLSGTNSRGLYASGRGTMIYRTDNYIVNGEGATAIRVGDSAEGIISNPIVLNGKNSLGALSEAGDTTLYASSSVTGSGDSVTAYQVNGDARIEHQGQVDLTGKNNTAVRLNDGNFINRGVLHVASGTGIDVNSGYGQFVPVDSQLRVDDGTAAIRVGNGFLNLIGDGWGASTLQASGTADAVLLDTGASGLAANQVIFRADGSGSVLNNRAETSNISLDNIWLDAAGATGIRSATSFDYGGTAFVNVTRGATGYLFSNEDGSTTSNDLVLGPGYTINVVGAGTAIRANTTGQVINDGTIIINDAEGGSAVVTRTASEVINRGAITSYSTTAPVIDLRGGESLFVNLGTLTAPNPQTVVVAGGATNDQIVLLDGSVLGDVNTGNGTDTLAITGGTIDGSLTMGTGKNNVASIQNVSLAKTRHITTAGGEGSTLNFSEITARGASLSGGDNLSNGVNLGAGWSTINFFNTDWTLTDDLKLAHSTINIDAGSTLFVGDDINPVLSGATNDSLVVNNAGQLDLTNGGNAANNTLTINGDLVSQGGGVRLRTLLNSNAASSDRVLINGNASGTTLVNDALVADHNSDRNNNGITEANEGVSLAQVSGTASADSFALRNGYVAGGPWQYSLYSFAPGRSDAAQRQLSGSGNQFWDYRLANTFICEEGSLCQPQTAGTARGVRPAVIPQLPSYISAPVGLAYYTLSMVDDLHKRLGELRSAQSTSGSANGEMFVRYVGSNLSYKSNLDVAHYGYDFDLDYSGVQIGGNLLKLDGPDDSLRGGIAYTRGNTRIQPKAADGFSSTTFDSDSVALYGTWLRENGLYLDGSLSWNWHRGDTDIARQKEVAKLKGKGWTASVETGYPWAFANGVRLEPQAQLIYLQLKMDNVTDKDNTRVSWDDYDQTIGRVGARLDRTWQDDASRQYTPYLRTNYYRGWGGAAKTTVGSTNSTVSEHFTSGKFGQMWDVGVGGTATLKNDVSLYAEADYRKEIDGNGTKGWRYNAGVRWTF